MTTAATAPAADRTSAPDRIGSGALAGTGTLIRFGLRRDRVRIPVWVVALTPRHAVHGHRVQDPVLHRRGTRHGRQLHGQPAALAMTGPRHYLDDYDIGSMTGHQLLGFMAVLVGLMSVLIVTRHTRDEEETGRAELVRSTVVGHHAQLASALVVATVANSRSPPC